MKTVSIAFSMAAYLLFTACGDQSKNANSSGTNNQQAIPDADRQPATNISAPGQDILKGYLALKNALANDQSGKAADAANTITSSLDKTKEEAFTPDQKKIFSDIKEDMKEHAEHIADNSNNIKHQREHFDIMSQDMIDLLEATGSNQTLYKVYCPMYNNNKGASWLSETREIKNPYMGKKMPTCGEIKQEIKPNG